MTSNTSALQRALDTWRKTSGREIDASIQRFISPMGFGHINFNGVIVFPFEHYRTQLLARRRGFALIALGTDGRTTLGRGRTATDVLACHSTQ
jgi:hypothetical protein